MQFAVFKQRSQKKFCQFWVKQGQTFLIREVPVQIDPLCLEDVDLQLLPRIAQLDLLLFAQVKEYS